MNKKPQSPKKREPSSPELKKQEERARRWRRTGVSPSTINWMRANHLL